MEYYDIKSLNKLVKYIISYLLLIFSNILNNRLRIHCKKVTTKSKISMHNKNIKFYFWFSA